MSEQAGGREGGGGQAGDSGGNIGGGQGQEDKRAERGGGLGWQVNKVGRWCEKARVFVLI